MCVQELRLRECVSLLRGYVSKRPVTEGSDVRWGVVCLKSWCHETPVCVCERQRFLFLGHAPLCILEAPVHTHSPLPSCVSVPLCGVASTCACDRRDPRPPCGVCASCGERGASAGPSCGCGRDGGHGALSRGPQVPGPLPPRASVSHRGAAVPAPEAVST